MAQQKDPVRTRRTVVEVGIEACPGAGTAFIAPEAATDHDRYPSEMPIYDTFNPIQADIETIPLNRAKNSLAPEGFGIAIPRYTLSGKAFVVGATDWWSPPKWAEFIEMSGFNRQEAYNESTLSAPSAAGGPDPVDGVTEVDVGTGVHEEGCTWYYVLTFDAREDVAAPSGADAIDSLPSTEVSHTVTADGLGARNLDLDLTSANADRLLLTNAADIGINIYRSAQAGGPYVRINQTGIQATSFTDDVADEGTNAASASGRGAESAVRLQPPIDSTIAPFVGTKFVGEDFVIYRPLDELHASGFIRVFLDCYRHISNGVRGALSFAATAGQLVEANFDVQGRYLAATQEDNPTGGGSPGIPPRFCGSDSRNVFTITAYADGAERTLIPIITAFGLTTGGTPTDRLDGNDAACLKEIGLFNEFDPRFTATVETDCFSPAGATFSKGFEWVDQMNDAEKFQFCLEIITPGKSSWFFFLPGFTAQNATAPQYSDSNGIRTLDLDLQLGNIDPLGAVHDFLWIIHGSDPTTP